MARRKPCSFCGTWFTPDPRVGSRQKACFEPACQQARNRTSCTRWRDEHPDYWRERRLRVRFKAAPQPSDAMLDADPLRALDWAEVRQVLGVATAVALWMLGVWLRRGLRGEFGGGRPPPAGPGAQHPGTVRAGTRRPDRAGERAAGAQHERRSQLRDGTAGTDGEPGAGAQHETAHARGPP